MTRLAFGSRRCRGTAAGGGGAHAGWVHTSDQQAGDTDEQAIQIDDVDDGGRKHWDNNAGCCGFLFEATWQAIQARHAGTFVTNAYITTDPGITVDVLVDNLNVAGRSFSQAADNGNGTGTDGADNTAAFFTPDLLSLLANPIG